MAALNETTPVLLGTFSAGCPVVLTVTQSVAAGTGLFIEGRNTPTSPWVAICDAPEDYKNLVGLLGVSTTDGKNDVGNLAVGVVATVTVDGSKLDSIRVRATGLATSAAVCTASTPVAPVFANIASKPTTLAGYGIAASGTGGIAVQSTVAGAVNMGAGTTTTYTLPDNTGGMLNIRCTQPGVALSQTYQALFSTHNGVTTLEAAPRQIGAGTEFSVGITGLVVTVTATYATSDIVINTQTF